MAGHFELRKSTNGQFNFVLKAGNGETILQSQQHQSKAAAQGGIASVMSNGTSAAIKDLTVDA